MQEATFAQLLTSIVNHGRRQKGKFFLGPAYASGLYTGGHSA